MNKINILESMIKEQEKENRVHSVKIKDIMRRMREKRGPKPQYDELMELDMMINKTREEIAGIETVS